MAASDRLGDFEARLAALKHKMEAGLVDRARALREMATRLDAGDDAARKQIKTESHKLRGVAGSYGHHDLTEAAANLEQRASISPPVSVGQMARELADLAESKGRDSTPPEVERAMRSQPPRAARSSVSSQPPRPTGNAEAARVAGKALRVLAMDDDPITQRLLLLTLQQVGGFDATIVKSAAEALELLREQHFDVVVSDAMMPDMNGMDFRRAARARGITSPIIILSAASPDELGWVPGSSSGPWLRKPFKPTQLVKDILRIVAQHR